MGHLLLSTEIYFDSFLSEHIACGQTGIPTNQVYCILDNPYAVSLAVIMVWGRQSNALDRSMRIAAAWSPLSSAFRHSSDIAISTDWQLKPLWKAGSELFRLAMESRYL